VRREHPQDLAWVIDDAIPLTPSLSALLGNVTALPGRDITASALRHADGLLVRSVTRVDKALLDGPQLRFVGSATAGVDHIDTECLARRGIPWAAAPGSNAIAVVEYVLSALALSGYLEKALKGAPVGLVGLGEVGSQLLNRLSRLGCRVLVFDPMRAKWPAGIDSSSLDAVLSCPIVSLHANLHDIPPYASRHLVDSRAVEQLLRSSVVRDDPGVLINAARGELVCPRALDQLLDSPWRVILDTWPTEPVMSAEVLSRADWVSPHIAGHSVQAKLRGSNMLAAAIAAHWQVEPPPGASAPSVAAPLIDVGSGDSARNIAAACDASEAWVISFLLGQGTLEAADRDIRAAASPHLSAQAFDALRKSYRQPQEWTGRSIKISGSAPAATHWATRLGLNVIP